MFNAYSVGVSLKLTDLVTPALLKLSRDFAKFDTIVARTNTQLRALGRQAAGVKLVAQSVRQIATDSGIAGRQVGALNRHLAATGRAAGGIAAVGTAASQTTYALHRASQQAAALGRNLAGARSAAAAPIVLPGTRVVGRMRQGPLHGGGLSLSGAGVGVGAVGLGAGSQAGMVGAGAAIAGGVGLAAMYKGPLEASKSYEQAYSRFRTLNLGVVANKQADDFARSANVFAVSSTEMMDTLRETASFFGSMDMARRVAPTIAALNQANAQLFGNGTMEPGMARSLMRFVDMRGATNSVPAMLREIEVAQRVYSSSGGAIRFSDLEQVMKTGGVAAKSLSHQGLYNLASVMQEQGGPRLGTALMSMYQNMTAGRATGSAQAQMEALGLGRRVEEKIGSVGGKKQTRTRLVLNEEFGQMLRADPFTAFQRFVVPAIDRIYGKGGKASEDTYLKVINDALSNRTASNLGGTFATQDIQILRDAILAQRSMGVQGTIGEARNATGSDAQLRARWNSALAELGNAVLPMATEAVTKLASGVQVLGKYLRENQGEAKVLAFALTGLAASLAVGGTILAVSAAFKGLAAVLSVGGVLGTSVAGTTALLGAGNGGLAAALFGLSNPIGMAIAAIGTLAASIYAFRPMSQGEVDSHKRDGGVRLTPEAAARLQGMGETPGPKPLPAYKPWYQFWHNESGLGKLLGSGKQGDSTAHLRPTTSFYPRREGSPFIAPPANQMVQVTTQLNMDSRPIATAVTQHQADSAARLSGPRRFDPAQQLLPPGSIMGAR